MLGGWPPKRRWRAAGSGQASRRTVQTWCAARCRWCGTSSPSTGTSRCARPMAHGHYAIDPADMRSTRGREHDLRRADPRGDVHRLLRAGGPIAAALDQLQAIPASTSTFTWTPPAAASSPRSRARRGLRLGSPCQVDQRVGHSSAWPRWVSLAGSSGAINELPGDRSLRELPAATCQCFRSTYLGQPGR